MTRDELKRHNRAVMHRLDEDLKTALLRFPPEPEEEEEALGTCGNCGCLFGETFGTPGCCEISKDVYEEEAHDERGDFMWRGRI